MKTPADPREFNTPEEMLVRVGFIVFVASFAVGVLLVGSGLVARSLPLLGGGLCALGLGGALREWLRRRNGFETAELVMEELAAEGKQLDATRVAELVNLLTAWEQMEAKRGSSAFDPWALQVLRNDIRDAVERDPALESLFREIERRAA